MEFTTEALRTLYQRANQFIITSSGKEPERLELQEDGSITAKWEIYSRGHYSHTDEESINAEDLTRDLDEVATERIKREDEERKIRLAMDEIEKERREKAEKENRRIQYNKLKKEFE